MTESSHVENVTPTQQERQRAVKVISEAILRSETASRISKHRFETETDTSQPQVKVYFEIQQVVWNARDTWLDQAVEWLTTECSSTSIGFSAMENGSVHRIFHAAWQLPVQPKLNTTQINALLEKNIQELEQ